MNHLFDQYGPHRGPAAEPDEGRHDRQGGRRRHGLTPSTGSADRGIFFVKPGDKVYAGQIVGEQVKEGDMVIQPCEKKHLTNMRASGSDMAIKLTPARELNIEQAIEWINDDELVEVAPAAIRVRKRTLDHSLRKVKAKTAG